MVVQALIVVGASRCSTDGADSTDEKEAIGMVVVPRE